MSESKTASIKWPVCTILILALVGGMIYWGYTAFRAEQTMTRATIAPPAQKAGGSGSGSGVQARRLPLRIALYFLVGFALVMTAILGSIIYFWWSLKDLEGGKRYGEEEEEVPAPDSGKVSAP